MYSFDSKVRYSEVDHNCTMDLSTIINYFQDCSCFQSESLGVGVEHLKKCNYAWLLSSWQIIVNRYPSFAEDITTSTWAYGFDSLYGYRNFLIRSKDGGILAMANSNWICVDLTTGHPMRLTEEMIHMYPVEPRFEGIEYANRKVTSPKDYVEQEPFPVLLHHIDSNQHVNNGQYVKMAQQYLPEDFKIWQMRAEYKRQALLGDVLTPRVTISKQLCTVALVNTEGMPYCVIEFTQQV